MKKEYQLQYLSKLFTLNIPLEKQMGWGVETSADFCRETEENKAE